MVTNKSLVSINLVLLVVVMVMGGDFGPQLLGLRNSLVAGWGTICDVENLAHITAYKASVTCCAITPVSIHLGFVFLKITFMVSIYLP